MTELEAFAAITGFLAVFLAVRNRVENWPVGIVSCLTYVAVFARGRLFVSLGIQLLYIGTSIFGWWSWRRRGPDGDELPVRRLRLSIVGLLFVAALLLTMVMGWLLARWSDDPAPFWDGAIGAYALTAMAAMSRRYLQHWWFWTVTNVLGIGLYAWHGLYATVLLWASYQVLCIAGMVSWKKRLLHPANAEPR